MGTMLKFGVIAKCVLHIKCVLSRTYNPWFDVDIKLILLKGSKLELK